jgi:phage terminase small subunit
MGSRGPIGRGRTPDVARSPALALDIGDAPEYLDSRERAIYDSLKNNLAGRVEPAHQAVVVLAAQSIARLQMIRQRIASLTDADRYDENARGGRVLSPVFAEEKQAFAQVLELSKRLGLSPADSARLPASDPEQSDGLTDFEGGV